MNKQSKYLKTDLVWTKVHNMFVPKYEYGIIAKYQNSGHPQMFDNMIYKVEFKNVTGYSWIIEEELELYSDIFRELTNNEI